MKLAANIHFLYGEWPPLERIAAAAADGFEGIEFPFPHDLDVAELGAKLRQAALPLVLVNTPLGPEGEPGFAAVPGAQKQFRHDLERTLALAHRLACPRVHVMAGRPGPDALASGSAMAVLEDNLRWAAPLARDAGVVLLLEPLNHHDTPGYAYHQPAQVVALLERLNEAGVRLQFDFFHVAREELDVSAALLAHQKWIHHVQIASAPNRTRPEPDKPEVAQALRTLRDLGYSGWLGLEYHPEGPTGDSLGWRKPLRALLEATTGSAT